MQNNETLTAVEQFRKKLPAEKFEILLKSVQTLDMAFADLAAKQQTVIESVLLLYKQLKALMAVLNINEQHISAVAEQMEIEELKAKVESLKQQNILKEVEEAAAITENSFVVLRVLQNDGQVYTARLQVPVKLLSEELQKALMGLKKGDAAHVNNLIYEVLEIYEILSQQSDQLGQDSGVERHEKLGQQSLAGAPHDEPEHAQLSLELNTEQ